LSMRSLLAIEFDFAGNAAPWIIGDRTVSNHQVASTGQAVLPPIISLNGHRKVTCWSNR